MSEREFQPDLDGELLSAYLDDELTAEERAAVEARLANDPDAQLLLHQLRSVSQSVQMLPLEGVGRDLSGEILQRIEAKKRGDGGDGSDNSAGVGEITPRLPIFGSRRSWIWATVAVAAGLMIMVLERGEEKGNQLPAVARNEGAGGTLARHNKAESFNGEAKSPVVNGGKDESSVANSGAPGKSNVASAPSPAAASSRMDTDKLASRELKSEPSVGAASAGNSVSSDQFAASRRTRELRDSPTVAGGAMPQGSAGTLSGAGDDKAAAVPHAEPKAEPGFGPGQSGPSSGFAVRRPGELEKSAEKQAAIEDGDGLVVIHVSAKPAAIRGGEFEKLLARNGVEFDAKDKIEEAVSSSDAKKSLARPAGPEDVSRNKAVENNLIDAVVVDAPRDVVAACLADLQQDESNFASVEVEPPAAEKNDAATTNVAKELGSELRHYNRAMISNTPSPSRRVYGPDSAGQDRAKLKDLSQSAAGGGGPSEQNAQHASQANRGRASRVRVAQVEDQTLSDSLGRRAGGFGGGGGGESEQLRRDAAQQQKPRNENPDEVRVLFMLKPEEAVPGPTKKAAD